MNRSTFYALALISASALHMHAGNSQLRAKGVNVRATSKAFAKNALHTSICAGITAGSAWLIKQENLPIENPNLRMGIKAGAGILGILVAGSVASNIAQKYKHLNNVSRAKQLRAACDQCEQYCATIDYNNDPTFKAWHAFIQELEPYTQKIYARKRIALLQEQIEAAKQDGNFTQNGWKEELDAIRELQKTGKLDKPWFETNVINAAINMANEMVTGSYFKHQAHAAFTGIFTGIVGVATACYKLGLFSRLSA